MLYTTCDELVYLCVYYLIVFMKQFYNLILPLQIINAKGTMSVCVYFILILIFEIIHLVCVKLSTYSIWDHYI